MNQQQRKHLNQRIDAAQRAIRNRIYKAKTAIPAEVKKAQATVNAWEHKVSMAHEASFKSANEAVNAAREVVLFGDPDEALKAVKKLEQEARKPIKTA